MKTLLWIVVLIIVIGGGWYIWSDMNSVSTPAVSSTATSTVPADTYGMTEYTDATYGFSFWYPSSEVVSASTTNDNTSFPGGTEVERLEVGDQGSTYVAVVTSPNSTITDEPNGHASPIEQTKYFFATSTNQWMMAHPDASVNGGADSTTTADVSKSTVGGLVMLPSGARFDTTIIVINQNQFLVIGDGGGSSFTSELAQTVSAAGATVDPTALSAALQAEATAYTPAQ